MRLRVDNWPTHVDVDASPSERLVDVLARAGFTGPMEVRSADGILLETWRCIGDFGGRGLSFPVPSSRPGIDGVVFVWRLAPPVPSSPAEDAPAIVCPRCKVKNWDPRAAAAHARWCAPSPAGETRDPEAKPAPEGDGANEGGEEGA